MTARPPSAPPALRFRGAPALSPPSPRLACCDAQAAYDGLLSDVWSLGVMLHVMLCYKLPFEVRPRTCFSSFSLRSCDSGVLRLAPSPRHT